MCSFLTKCTKNIGGDELKVMFVFQDIKPNRCFLFNINNIDNTRLCQLLMFPKFQTVCGEHNIFGLLSILVK